MEGLQGMRRMAAMLIAAAGMLLVSVGWGAEEGSNLPGGITVQGNGTAKAKPTQVEIDCTITADAELATDATVKFRDAKKRALAAIEGMKNPDVKVNSNGLSISNAPDAAAQQAMMRGMPVTPGKARVMIVEKNKIVITNADKLEPEALLETVLKVLDVAKDAGFTVGPSMPSNPWEAQQMGGQMANGMVQFKVPDGVSLRDEAYKSAIEDAKGKAQKLAELSGCKLGSVKAIQQQGGGDDKVVSSNTTGELTKHISLTVQFEISGH
jgi:uncharacterized protein YggE